MKNKTLILNSFKNFDKTSRFSKKRLNTFKHQYKSPFLIPYLLCPLFILFLLALNLLTSPILFAQNTQLASNTQVSKGIKAPQNSQSNQSKHSRPNVKRLISCLGKEEEGIHRSKTEGPIYQLNQTFLNELVGLDELNIKEKYLQEICQGKDYAPSVGLLKILILQGIDAFDLSPVTGQKNALPAVQNKVIIEELLSNIPLIFFNYLSTLQLTFKRPNCLEKEIPEISFFQERFMYLQENLSYKDLIKQKAKLETIFNKLKKFNQLYLKCSK